MEANAILFWGSGVAVDTKDLEMGPGVGVGVEMKELLRPKIGPGPGGGVGVGVAKLPIVVNMLPKNEPVNCAKISH